jgi:pyruvate dehydrogenase E2 component (dihydrolipoamide acetyltransferase)
MAVSVVMPALELAQETGRLLAWRKHEGDRVTKGEPLLEVETDKAVVEIEAPGEGILTGVSAREGAVVPVGQIIAWLIAPGEAAPLNAPAGEAGRQPAPTARPVFAAVEAATVGAQNVGISPKARRLARERGIDLATITGSGPRGEILAADIPESAQLHSDTEPLPETGYRQSAPGNLQPPPGILQSEISNLQPRYSALMAERTARSWTSVPHFFLTRDIDASGLLAARERLVTCTYTDLIVGLVARVLRKHPRLNAGWIDGAIRLHPDPHVAIAIAARDAVVTGVVHGAAALTVGEIARRRKELTERAQAGRLEPADISGATFTVSNLGMYHVDSFTAIIVPPQAGILAVGAITDRVVAVDGRPAVRPMMTMTLSCDHRVVDGVRGVEFLVDLADAIGRPEAWIDCPGN